MIHPKTTIWNAAFIESLLHDFLRTKALPKDEIDSKTVPKSKTKKHQKYRRRAVLFLYFTYIRYKSGIRTTRTNNWA